MMLQHDGPVQQTFNFQTGPKAQRRQGPRPNAFQRRIKLKLISNLQRHPQPLYLRWKLADLPTLPLPKP